MKEDCPAFVFVLYVAVLRSYATTTSLFGFTRLFSTPHLRGSNDYCAVRTQD